MRGLVLPEPSEDFTADPVELFFDLAFVFAFSQLVYLLVHHPTWTGVGEALLLFLILWFAWSVFTWAANAVSGNSRSTRAFFLVATATSVPMGASVTNAFDSGGATFAICASMIIFMGIGLQLWGHETGSDQFRSVARFLLPNALGAVVLIAGGFLDGSTRVWLWIAFVVALFGSTVAAGSEEWVMRPGHFAERHGLIIIIALGEVVVAIGISVVTSLDDADGLPGHTLAALVAAGALAGLLWWSYFDRVLPALEHRAESLTGRARGNFARDIYTWMHAFIVAGIITTAAATEEILLHPRDAVLDEFRIMFVAGLALFFLGVAATAFRAWKVLAKERLAALVLVIIVVAATASLSGLAVLLAVDVVIALTLISEHLRIEHPHKPSAAIDV